MQRRKTPVKGASVFIATCLTQGPDLLIDHTGEQLACELLGLGVTPLRSAAAQLGDGGDSRAQVLLLGSVLAALETRTPQDAWRAAASRWNSTPGAAEYLRLLAAIGYTLAPIERVVIGERTSDDVFTGATAPAE